MPDEVTSQGRLVRLPPAPQLPEPLRGRAFVKVEAAYLGDAGTGAELTQPYRGFRRPLDHLATLTRDLVRFAGAPATVPMLDEPARAHRDAFEFPGIPVPPTLK